MSDLDDVRARYREVNGDHPMTPDDDAYVRDRFVPATDAQLAEMVAGRLPLPSYLLSDGTPMVPADLDQLTEWAGGPDRLHDWWVSHWPDDGQDAAEEEWRSYLSGQYVCLKAVSPVAVLDKERLVAQAKAAVEVLAGSPHDADALGSLHEAVTWLERILLPQTDYDRLRFGAPSSWQTWVEDARRDHLTPRRPELPLRTERLVLRTRSIDDLDATYTLHGDPEVTRYLLHRPWTRLETLHRIRSWIEPSDGSLSLGVELDGRLIGEVVLLYRGAGQAEIGWIMNPTVHGRGYATEAARELLRVGFEHYGFHRIYAELDARNGPSARLAERLGMRRESHRLHDFWSQGEWTDTLQYAVLDSEWRAAQQ